MTLNGQVALVTGASQPRSIGWGIAKALAEAGAEVVVNDAYHLDDLQARAAELQALGQRSLALKADVTDAAQVTNMVAQTVAQLGRLDVVVSNAGIIRWERFPNIMPESLRSILRVNLLGNVNVCRAAATRMIEQGEGGRIIFVSSVQSDVQFPSTPIYGASKHAMHALVGSVALELAPYAITVNHIGPGWVRSPLNDAAPDQQTAADLAAQRDAVPLHRDGSIEEIGAAVSYLASPQAAYTTGAFIRIDGGLGISKYS